MHRFAPALRRVARDLDLPRGVRAAILQELAADLDAVYEHHRTRGMDDGEARQRAEESVLGSADVVRRLARLHRRSWRGWSESMATRLTGGVDLLMLVLGVVPVLLAAAVLVVRAGLQSSGPLVWATGVAGLLIVVAIAASIRRAARGLALRSALLETLPVAGAAAFALGGLGLALGLHATSQVFASSHAADAAALATRLVRDGTVTAAGLLLAIAALFSWFLLLGREAARLADEVDALLGAEPEPHSPTVIPFTTGRTA
ncbi:MAG: hypothetical protein ACYC28_00825 [Longimicrobiales bacterium]